MINEKEHNAWPVLKNPRCCPKCVDSRDESSREACDRDPSVGIEREARSRKMQQRDETGIASGRKWRKEMKGTIGIVSSVRDNNKRVD